ncbi:MAG: disulfide oxidoreductase [Patescibacteria group bacterium]
MDVTDLIVTGYSVLTVLGQGILLILLWFLLFAPEATFLRWARAHALPLMLVVAVLGTLGSLYFSEVAGWTPCKFCWYQRIFLYPQVILLGIALIRRDRAVASYVLVLSCIGLLIALLHYKEQVVAMLFPPDALVPCDETGVSCARTPFFHFGYITIPMMAATAFALNIAGSALLLQKRKL